MAVAGGSFAGVQVALQTVPTGVFLQLVGQVVRVAVGGAVVHTASSSSSSSGRNSKGSSQQRRTSSNRHSKSQARRLHNRVRTCTIAATTEAYKVGSLREVGCCLSQEHRPRPALGAFEPLLLPQICYWPESLVRSQMV